MHTRWIETEMAAAFEPQPSAPAAEAAARETITVEVGGKRLEVVVPAVCRCRRVRRRSRIVRTSACAARRRPPLPEAGSSGGSGDSLVTPMQGTIVKIVAAEGTQVSAGDTVVILEAMKMEQPLTAHKDGTVTGLAVEVGQTVTADTEICQIKD